jgi:uncharacterized membrane protein
MESLKKILKVEIDINRARDTGMAMVLILLSLEFLVGGSTFLKIAIPVLIINMIVPHVFYPLAYLWFGLAHLIGTLVSKILLFLVYIFVVMPVGLFRRAIGKDSMSIKKWKQGSDSVFKIRNHLYSASDIEKPY